MLSERARSSCAEVRATTGLARASDTKAKLASAACLISLSYYHQRIVIIMNLFPFFPFHFPFHNTKRILNSKVAKGTLTLTEPLGEPEGGGEEEGDAASGEGGVEGRALLESEEDWVEDVEARDGRGDVEGGVDGVVDCL